MVRLRALASGVVMLTLFSFNHVYAQIDIIQDSKGETSFENFQNSLKLNFDASEFSIKGFKVLKSFEDKGEITFGLGLNLGASKGKTVLFSDSELISKGAVSFSLGGRINNDQTDADWYPYFTMTRTAKSLNLWDSSDPISLIEEDVTNQEFQIGVTRTGAKYPIISAAVRFGRTDNSSALESGTFSSVFMGNGSLLQIDSKEAIGPASDFDENVNDFTFLADLVWVVKRIGIPASIRYYAPDIVGLDPVVKIGSGVFINKSLTESNKFVGGILFQNTDLFKANTNDSFFERVSITLMVGIPLGDAL